MALEDFGTYSKTDPNSRITKTTRRVTTTLLQRDEDAYVYKDKGVDNYNGNFTFLLTFRVTGGTNQGLANFWALTNLVDDWFGIDSANGDGLSFACKQSAGPAYTVFLQELDGGTAYSAGYTISVDTTYYITLERDESVGAYGTVYMHIYSDPSRATLLTTLFITLHTSKKDYRYLYACQSFNTGQDWALSAYIENLEEIDVTPTVTTQPVTDITTTAATGNGTIVDLGIATVTEHGVCWATTIDPTTSDSKTTEGQGSLGAFTSSMTNLLAGQKYWVRTYATNTEGTAYGANVTFTAGYISTQLIQGNLAIVQGHLQYIDASGVEKYIPGIPA